MIRINLAPTKKRRSKGAASAPSVGRGGSASAGQIWIFGFVLGWAGLGGLGYWLVGLEQDASEGLRVQTSTKNKQIEKIKKDIDEEGLKARKAEIERSRAAFKKVNQKRRTPVFVMYEIAMILTPQKDGGGTDIDLEKQRRNLKEDPQSALNARWDPTGLWMTSMSEQGGVLSIKGKSRDAADLTEFNRRLRVSARFGKISNINFIRDGSAQKSDDARHLAWELSAQVRRWD